MKNKILVWKTFAKLERENMYIIKQAIYPVLLYLNGIVYDKVLKFVLAHPTLLDFDPFIPYIGLSHDFSDGVKYKSETLNIGKH